MRRHLVILLSLPVVLVVSGCVKKFTIRPPTPSLVRYDNPTTEGKALSVVDARSGEATKLSIGTLGAVLVAPAAAEQSSVGRRRRTNR